jgi:hypothetical protein
MVKLLQPQQTPTGTSGGRRGYRRWTQQEEDYLDQNMERKSLLIMAIDLDRTEKSVTKKIQNRGLTRKMSVMTGKDVAEVFGVTQGSVMGWIRRGQLSARKGPIGCGGGGRVWVISDSSIRNFIHDRTPRAHWHWESMPEGYWREYARRIWRGRPRA